MAPEPPGPLRRARPATEGMVALAGGRFTLGSDDALAYPEDGEGTREVELSAFRIDACAVVNDRFAEFVAATSYVTEAERFGWSFVFGGLLPDDFPPTRGVAGAPWWRQVDGADWRHPAGPQSDLVGRADHPVVHTSWNDAAAFCAWAGGRLPSGDEWEAAARGADARPYPWGETFDPERCACAESGWGWTVPVVAHPEGAGPFGAEQQAGNVWEWVAGHDEDGWAAVRGGSYLDTAWGLRASRVQPADPWRATNTTGFRIVIEGGT